MPNSISLYYIHLHIGMIFLIAFIGLSAIGCASASNEDINYSNNSKPLPSSEKSHSASNTSNSTQNKSPAQTLEEKNSGRLKVIPTSTKTVIKAPVDVCNCKGHAGIGGPCYDGIGGPAYAGIGGPAYAGIGGPCYDGIGGPAYSGIGGPAYSGIGGACHSGIGGPAYDGIGGPAYAGIGGPCYDGIGGPCYSGIGGGKNCPAICSCND